MKQSHQTDVEVLGIDAGGGMIEAFFRDAEREFVVGKAQATPQGRSAGMMVSSAGVLEQRRPSVEEVFPRLLTSLYSGTAMLHPVLDWKGLRAGSIVAGWAEDFHRKGRAIAILAVGGALAICGAVALIVLLPAVWIVAVALVIAPMSAVVAARVRSSRALLASANALKAMHQRLEDERCECSRRVLAAQEAERLRIARELHDEIGQTLTAVALRAERSAQRAGSQHPEFAELAGIVQQSLADVRRISLDLRPGALDELGLINALISLCARVESESPLRIRRALEGPFPDLPPDVELAVYRIAQEALTNVMRHSGSSEVDMAVTCTGDQLVLSVRDNGRGLPEHVREGGGLTGMRERAMLIAADLDVRSTGDSGVSVTLRLPLGR